MPLNVRSPHARGVHSSSQLALIAVAGMAFLLSSTVAHADAVRCKREIAKASAKFAQAKMKVLQKCEDGRLTGKISGSCPDTKAGVAITKAAGKLRTALDKKCGGLDH